MTIITSTRTEGILHRNKAFLQHV